MEAESDLLVDVVHSLLKFITKEAFSRPFFNPFQECQHRDWVTIA